MPDATIQETRLLYPLDEFYTLAGLELPRVREIDGERMPQPYRRLLVHDHDMTPTLEAFHSERVHVRPLQWRESGDTYARQVVLTLNGSETPVEFGAIVIHLQHFPDIARREILSRSRPLGTILAAHHLAHESRPCAFIELTSDPLMDEALGLDGATTLYGRRNRLLTPAGEVIAEIVEIVPPLEEGTR